LIFGQPVRDKRGMSRPLRVAHVITRMIVGGAQELVLSLMERLDPSRFASVLFTGNETGPEGSLLRRAADREMEIVSVPPLVRSPRPVKDLMAFAALRRAFRKGRFDIVNTYTSKAGFIGTLAARAAGVPVVVYSPQGHIFARGGRIEGVSGRPLRRRLFLTLRRWACRAADAIVALHEGDLEEQVDLRLAPRWKFRVIPNGIDPGRYGPPDSRRSEELRRKLGIAESSPVLATVGRLTSEKGHEDLVAAMGALARTHPAAVLLVAGDGPRRTSLEEQARALGLARRVRFLGLRADVPDILAAADVFLLASRYESFGLAILEAMAAGLPVIAARVGGIPFVVEDGKTGFLVDARRPEDIADRVRALAEDPEKRASLGRAGRARLLERFSVDAMIRGVESMYTDLARAKGLLP